MAAATVTRPAPGALRVLGLLLLLLAGCEDTQTAPKTADVEISGRRFTLELALTDDARFQGLSDRASIDPDGGMLFAFTTPAHRAFVMRRCLVPIDIIFLDGAGRVVSTHAMQVEPPDTPERRLRQYRSGWPAQYAIELAGGTLRELEVKEGQKVDLPLDLLKRWAE